MRSPVAEGAPSRVERRTRAPCAQDGSGEFLRRVPDVEGDQQSLFARPRS